MRCGISEIRPVLGAVLLADWVDDLVSGWKKISAFWSTGV